MSLEYILRSKKYEKKIRLLVTNICFNNCNYCHNEGMSKQEVLHLNPNELEPYLLRLRKISSRIILSGGEPLEYIYLGELLQILCKYDFDITVNTSTCLENCDMQITNYINNVHISLHDFMSIKDIKNRLQNLRKLAPTINIVLNSVVINENNIINNIDELLNICRSIGARIQLIKVFNYEECNINTWSQRWQKILVALEKYEIKFHESTTREISFMTSDFIKIDLAEIPCVSSGREFKFGDCINNSDITIDPSLSIYFCRWQEKNKVRLTDPQNIDNHLLEAIKKSFANCRFGDISQYLYPLEIEKYMFSPHYKWPQISDNLEATSSIQVRNGVLSYLGKNGYVLRLENEFAAYIGTKYALSVCSGTAALFLSFFVAGIDKDDEIIIPAMSFPTVCTALIMANIKIRVCDVDINTGNIDLNSFRQNINKNVKGVVITHLWGDPVEMCSFKELCKRHNITIIEDCSHAFGAEYDNKRVGSLGDIACFSLQANKTVYAGEGGIITTSNKDLYEKAVVHMSSQNMVFDNIQSTLYKQYWETGLGLKLKIHPLGAVIALDSLKNLELVNKKRNFNVEILNEAFEGSIIMRPPKISTSLSKRVYYTYKPLFNSEFISKKDEFINKLLIKNMQISASSFIPIYKTFLYTHDSFVNKQDSFPNAEFYYNRIVSMPSFTHEPEELVRFYADEIRKQLNFLQEQR
ncbi:MAG: aminotransferase class I/II-fold pyridoxal phosphate-dependent enzyme [Treponema sp.]|jgi:dTDP-4-amino-4,6-dideoxygalactose transaminase/molybdenum cofactor biosynthesis enzyme MoaA|nr:aminotransferase class I/II-fold pyridoxal phosphate-dependent enzyme [Treponema sp.]